MPDHTHDIPFVYDRIRALERAELSTLKRLSELEAQIRDLRLQVRRFNKENED